MLIKRDIMPNLKDNPLLKEIVSTETSYKESLERLINILDGAVIGDTATDLNEHIKGLKGVSEEIINSLEDTFNLLNMEVPDVRIQIFHSLDRQERLKTFFERCTQYLPIFMKVQKLLNDAAPESGIAYINQEVSTANAGLGLGAVLIMPIQRATRYELLLKELCKDNSLDERQQLIVETLYKKAKQLNTNINAAQEEINAAETAKEKAEKGYELGDITRGNYTFGSITQRMKHTIWGSDKKDDTEVFEMIEDPTP